jgi:hypothetical protein
MKVSVGTVKRYLADALTFLGQKLDTSVERTTVMEASN